MPPVLSKIAAVRPRILTRWQAMPPANLEGGRFETGQMLNLKRRRTTTRVDAGGRGARRNRTKTPAAVRPVARSTRYFRRLSSGAVSGQDVFRGDVGIEGCSVPL